MNNKIILALALIAAGFLLGSYLAHADPTGATILSNSTAGTPTSTPDSRTDARGTITTLTLSTVQQDQNWKAYVGNVSGRLSLDNANGFTIYDWTLAGSIAGEVYVSRHPSPDFTNVSCANAANITQEESFFDMTNGASDDISNTYQYANHAAVPIGGYGTISANSCPSTATYINDTAQTIDGSQKYQSLILQDINDELIFVSIISDDSYGYYNNISMNRTYDFQIIIPENDINSTRTTYYFWTELG